MIERPEPTTDEPQPYGPLARGLEQSRRGETVYLGSFTEYADAPHEETCHYQGIWHEDGTPIRMTPCTCQVSPPTREQIANRLEDMHARWHSCDGNLYGRDECGWEGCYFYDAAEFALEEVQG